MVSLRVGPLATPRPKQGFVIHELAVPCGNLLCMLTKIRHYYLQMIVFHEYDRFSGLSSA